jgi:hypothetical protein
VVRELLLLLELQTAAAWRPDKRAQLHLYSMEFALASSHLECLVETWRGPQLG